MIFLPPFQRCLMRGMLVIACGFPLLTNANYIPTGDSTLYYQLGGEQTMPVPAYQGATSIPLQVESTIGLGYNCGVFNPRVALTNSLNSIKNSFQAIEQEVITNATGAITELPLYVVARADPPLYNILNNGVFGGREDIKFHTKDCNTMHSEAAQGQNPYADWASISMGNDWSYHMSLANLHNSFAANSNTSQNDDINQVAAMVNHDNGNQGVPWVHGVQTGRGGLYAGGLGQPAIAVLHDTSVAGYNVILEANRAYDDPSTPAKTPANTHLVETWSNPLVAATWITNVLGDQIITTTNAGKKASTPGVGLLPQTQTLTTQMTQQLSHLVNGQTRITIQNLNAVSAPGIMMNRAVIEAIQKQPPVMQAIVINRLGQEVATAQVIDQALLAKQILEEGSQVPAIVSNGAAQKAIRLALTRLQADINNVLFQVQVRKALVSTTVTELLTTTKTHALQQTLVQPNREALPELAHGAIKNESEEKEGL